MKHPWRKGQVERMSRTIEDAAPKRVHDDSRDRLRSRPQDLPGAHDLARRPQTPTAPTPRGFICRTRTPEPQRLTPNPIRQTPESNS